MTLFKMNQTSLTVNSKVQLWLLACINLLQRVNYRPQRSWVKVIFSQACVKNCVHRGGRVSASVHAGIHPPGADPPGSRPPREQTPPRSRHSPPGANTPPRKQTAAYGQHTVNERPVRILLECILVVSNLLFTDFRKWFPE